MLAFVNHNIDCLMIQGSCKDDSPAAHINIQQGKEHVENGHQDMHTHVGMQTWAEGKGAANNTHAYLPADQADNIC